MSKKVFIIKNKNKKRRKISYLPKVKVRGNSDSKFKQIEIKYVLKKDN